MFRTLAGKELFAKLSMLLQEIRSLRDQPIAEVCMCCGFASVAHDADDAQNISALQGLRKPMHRTTANEARAPPCPKTDEVESSSAILYRPSRKLQAETDIQPTLYLSQQNFRLASSDTENYEVINVTDILVTLELALDVLIQRVEIDERQQLRQQIADRKTSWLFPVSIGHHKINNSTILNLPLYERP